MTYSAASSCTSSKLCSGWHVANTRDSSCSPSAVAARENMALHAARTLPLHAAQLPAAGVASRVTTRQYLHGV